jgi:hypothetical protein
MVWTHQLLCCESSILISVLIYISFRWVFSFHRCLRIDRLLWLPIKITRLFWEPVTNFSFFASVMPSEIRRFKLMARWLCDNSIVSGTFVVNGPQKRATTALLRFVQGPQISKVVKILTSPVRWNGHRSKEPINVSNIPFPLFCLRAVAYCVKTTLPSPWHSSVMWFSWKVGPQT